MAGSRDIKAGGAFVEFSLRRKGLERALKQVARRIQRFGANLTRIGTRIAAIGALITAPFLLATRTFLKFGDELDKMAARTGFSVSALSELGFAAGQTGTDMETLESGIKRMQRGIVDLGRGLSTQVDAFGALGLTFEDLSNLTPEEQFLTIAQAIASIEDPTERAARAMQVLGGAGQALIPLLSGGAGGIEALRREARELGLSISDETAAKAAKMADAIGILKLQAKVAAINIGAALAPAITKVADILSVAGRFVIDFTKKHGKLLAIAAAVAGSIFLLGGAIVALGVAAGITGFALSSIASAISTVSLPLVALIATLGLATFALFRFTDLGGQAVDFLKEKFNVLGVVAKRVFGDIAIALKGKSVILAAKLLWVNLKLVFFEGTRSLFVIFANLKELLFASLSKIGAGIGSIFTSALAGVAGVITDTIAVVAKGIGGMVTVLRDGFAFMVFASKQAGIAIREGLDPSFSTADAKSARARATTALAAELAAANSDLAQFTGTVDGIHNLVIDNITAESKARQEAIAAALAVELAAIQKAGDADRLRIQDRIDALNKERDALRAHAEARASAADLVDKFRDFFSGGSGGGRFKPDDFNGGQIRAVQAAASAGITSSFDIRGLNSGGVEAGVRAIGGDVKKMARDIADVARATREARNAGLSII